MRERELGLLAAGERAGVLEDEVAAQPEHAEQPAEVLVGESRLLADVLDDRAAGPDPFVLLRVVAHRRLWPRRTVAELGFHLAHQ